MRLTSIEVTTATMPNYKSWSCSTHWRHHSTLLEHTNLSIARQPSSDNLNSHLDMHTTTPLALSLLAVSALAAPPHLEARKGAAPVGGPATAKVTIYSSYTCTGPGTVSPRLKPHLRTRSLIISQGPSHRWQRRHSDHLHNLRRHMYNPLCWFDVRRSHLGKLIDNTKDWSRRM